MDTGAPYTVTGFKGGYATWLGAVKAAKARGATVTDKHGNQIYPPQASPQAAEAASALRANKCPICGSGVVLNSTIGGWVQCKQFGSDTHRGNPSLPACNWQGFTDGWHRKS